MAGSGGIDYLLEPGYIYFSKQPVSVRTVLGSSVAVCVWDSRQCCGAINHFLYPSTDDVTETTPRYGNAAVTAMLNIMEDEGCRPADLVAQIFGGGDQENRNGSGLGLRNVEVARSILARRGVKVVSEDVGGMMGRKIVFDIGTGHVAVLKVHRIRQTDWLSEPEVKKAGQE